MSLISVQVMRRRIDEIPGKWHCSIVGTCLPLADLRKIAMKARIDLPRSADDYQIHGAVVHNCGVSRILSRLVTKALDKRFPAHIARFARAETDTELAELWAAHVKAGDVPGAYWALMSHPLECSSLRQHAYGEVHMLSHLSGASQRVDMRRQADLERQLADRTNEVEALAAERARWRETETALRHDLAALDLHRRRSEDLEARLADLESGAAMAEARRDLREEKAAGDRLRLRVERLTEQLDRLRSEIAELTEHNARLVARSADLELRLCESAGCRVAGAGAGLERGAEPQPLDLARRRILYVGGMNRTVAHLKAIVDRHNGEFLHHDGGLEDGAERLDGVLSQADAVLCPVTCISHDAVDRIKRTCRRSCKAFMPLPSHSVSTFVRALRVVGRSAAEPDYALQAAE